MTTIKACPVCGSTEIEQSYIRKARPPVEPFKMTCKNCGWTGTPLEFDSKVAYDLFYKEMKNKNRISEKTEDEAWHEATSYIDNAEDKKRKRKSIRWRIVHTGVFILLWSVFLSFGLVSYLTYETITLFVLLFFFFGVLIGVINSFSIYYLGLMWFPLIDLFAMRKKIEYSMEKISTEDKIKYLWLSTTSIAEIGVFIMIFLSIVIWYLIRIPLYVIMFIMDVFLLFILIYSVQKTRDLKKQY